MSTTYRNATSSINRCHSLTSFQCSRPKEFAAEISISIRREDIPMDIRLRIGSIYSSNLWYIASGNRKILTTCRAKRPPPSENGESNNNSKDEKFSTDWDKAWSRFRKQGKKSLFSDFSPNKYVSWNPKRSEFPLSEEVDPIKRTERSNLTLWTSPRFTLVGAIVIVTLLLVYTIVVPSK